MFIFDIINEQTFQFYVNYRETCTNCIPMVYMFDVNLWRTWVQENTYLQCLTGKQLHSVQNCKIEHRNKCNDYKPAVKAQEPAVLFTNHRCVLFEGRYHYIQIDLFTLCFSMYTKWVWIFLIVPMFNIILFNRDNFACRK
jgi:hypothetical protein